MSKYTTELRYPVEQFLHEAGHEADEVNWKTIYGKLGLDDYPIFDEAYRETLNNKIIRAYYFREIGFETFGQFKWQLRRFMHEIMPYYNQLYLSQDLVTDPLASKDLSYTESWTRNEDTKRKASSKASTSGESKDRNLFQDTPMNGLDTGAIESGDYATTVTFDDTSTKSTTDNSSANDYQGDYEGAKAHNQKGYDKSQSELLLLYRKTFINIDLEIVERCDKLFLHVW